MFAAQEYNSIELLCRRNKHDNWMIVIPDSLTQDVIVWYRSILNHAGVNRMTNTINMHMWFSQMEERVKKHV